MACHIRWSDYCSHSKCYQPKVVTKILSHCNCYLLYSLLPLLGLVSHCCIWQISVRKLRLQDFPQRDQPRPEATGFECVLLGDQFLVRRMGVWRLRCVCALGRGNQGRQQKCGTGNVALDCLDHDSLHRDLGSCLILYTGLRILDLGHVREQLGGVSESSCRPSRRYRHPYHELDRLHLRYRSRDPISSEGDICNLARQYFTRIFIFQKGQQCQFDASKRSAFGSPHRCHRQLYRSWFIGCIQRHYGNDRHLSEHQLSICPNNSTHTRPIDLPAGSMEPRPSIAAHRMLLCPLDHLPFHHPAPSADLSRHPADFQLLAHLSGHRNLGLPDRVGFSFFWMGWSALVQWSKQKHCPLQLVLKAYSKQGAARHGFNNYEM